MFFSDHEVDGIEFDADSFMDTMGKFLGERKMLRNRKYINLTPNLRKMKKDCIVLASEIARNQHFEPFVELKESSVLKKVAQDC